MTSYGVAQTALFATGSDSRASGGRNDQTPRIMEDFDVNLLALARIRGAGLRAVRALVEHYSDLDRIWHDDPEAITAVLQGANIRNTSAIVTTIQIEGVELLRRARDDRARMARENRILISAADPRFPSRLLGVPGHPMWLFVEGDVDVLSRQALVAIVGTRTSSEAGVTVARQLTRFVLDEGFGIVSGLAEGIDAAAHMTALRVEAPQVAVLGTGLDVYFPASNSDLRRELVRQGGCVVTEYLPTDRYGKENFVQRNRIQAALASAVCPVEGRTQSGTAHTIRFAREYGRLIFGVYRHKPTSLNDMPALLQEAGEPVFDIATERGRAELRALLGSIEGARSQPPPQVDMGFWVGKAVQQIRELRSYYDLSDQEKDEVLAEVKRALQADD